MNLPTSKKTILKLLSIGHQGIMRLEKNHDGLSLTINNKPSCFILLSSELPFRDLISHQGFVTYTK